MSNNNESTPTPITPEQQLALEHLDKLLSYISATDLRDNLNDLFYGYLNSENADSQHERNTISVTHSEIIRFLTKISVLPTINRFK